MKVVILFNGTPIALPGGSFDLDSLIFEHNGFLAEFTYFLRWGEATTNVRYRYYAKNEFKREDQIGYSALSGYYIESLYLQYLISEIPIQSLTRFDFGRFIASPGQAINVEVLDNGTPFEDYYRVARFSFLIEESVNSTGARNYLNTNVIGTTTHHSIFIPVDHTKNSISYVERQQGSPDSYFYAINFGEKISDGSTNSANYWSRRKSIMNPICFKIHYINRDIFSKLSATLNMGPYEALLLEMESDPAFKDNDTVPILIKIIFLLKQSWGFYYDPDADQKYIFKRKPESVLTTLTNEELAAYWSSLINFYNSLYSFDLSSYDIYTRRVLYFDILYQLPDSTYRLFNYEMLLYIIKDFLVAKELTQQQQQVLVKAVIALAESDSHHTDFLEFLLVTDYVGDKSITNFEILYSLLADARKTRYPIVSWFVEEKENRRYFCYAIFKIWKYSKYNWDYNPSPLPPPGVDSDYLASYWYSPEGAQDFNENNVIEIIVTEPKGNDSESEITAYDFNTVLDIKKIDIQVQTKRTEYIQVSGPEVDYYTKVPPEFTSIGKFHLFQPITLINYEGNPNLDVPDSLTCPAFLIHFIKEYDEIADFDALIAFGINVGAELLLFFGLGGLGTLRYLRYLKYTTEIGQALRGTLPAAQSVKVWSGVSAASEGISVGAGLLASIGEYAATTENDPTKIETWNSIQRFLLGAMLLSAAGTLYGTARARRAADETLDLLRNSPTGQPFDTELETLLTVISGENAVRIANFAARFSAAGEDAEVLLLWLNDLSRKKQLVFLDYFGNKTIDELILFNRNPAVLDTWSELADYEAFRALSDFLVVDKLSKNPVIKQRVIELYDNLNSRLYFETLDDETWRNVFFEFINRFNFVQAGEIVEAIKLRPSANVQLIKTHFRKFKDNDGDKLSLENIFNIIKAGLRDDTLEFLTIKNFVRRDAIRATFRQDLAAHQSIPISRIEELLDCTATPQMVADVLPYFRGRQAIGRDYNVLLSTLRVYQDEVQVGADIHAIYYSSRQPLNFFTSSTLPSGVRDIDVPFREKYQAFSASAMDAGKKNRAFDTELKFIFNLLESDLWQQGNRFVLELESSLKVCSSCEGYLEYLLELGRRKGKVIEIRLKDNIEIKRIEHLK